MCSPLGSLGNGMVNCLNGNDLYEYEDTCSFTCNTGYELTGSGTRTCQSDRSWSGDSAFCREGNNTLCIHIALYIMCYIVLELSATANVTDVSISVAPTGMQNH